MHQLERADALAHVIACHRQQLERGRDSIALIAERCGYGSQSAFAQAFKQCWGLSPSSARQRVAQATQNNMRARANSLQGR